MISDHYGCQAASIKSYEEITLDVRNQTTNTHGGHRGTLPAPSQRRSRDLREGGGEAGASGGAVRGQQLSCAAQHCAVAPRGTNPGVLALGKGTAPLPGPLVKGFGNEILPEARAISKQFPLPYIFRKIKCRFIIIIIITFPFKECLLHIFFRSLSLRF